MIYTNTYVLKYLSFTDLFKKQRKEYNHLEVIKTKLGVETRIFTRKFLKKLVKYVPTLWN
jgi:hypothetical protein